MRARVAVVCAVLVAAPAAWTVPAAAAVPNEHAPCIAVFAASEDFDISIIKTRHGTPSWPITCERPVEE